MISIIVDIHRWRNWIDNQPGDLTATIFDSDLQPVDDMWHQCVKLQYDLEQETPPAKMICHAWPTSIALDSSQHAQSFDHARLIHPRRCRRRVGADTFTSFGFDLLRGGFLQLSDFPCPQKPHT